MGTPERLYVWNPDHPGQFRPEPGFISDPVVHWRVLSCLAQRFTLGFSLYNVG